MNVLTVYVVYEEDRGAGITIVGVYSSKEKAQEIANESGHYYLVESILE